MTGVCITGRKYCDGLLHFLLLVCPTDVVALLAVVEVEERPNESCNGSVISSGCGS